jgi:bifunctional UDP-N-acetylglucosamine pyrophosphorylase/glucosamine-1-phosphate N-acetyltransferase
MSATAIIMAAGRSTRMKSRRPKVLHEICGKPMLGWVIDACGEAGCEKLIVIVGHGKDEVIGQFESDDRIHWVEQSEQLGTGHAVQMCQSELKRQGGGDVFIVAGDGPLVRGQVLRTLRQAHQEARAAATMATAVLDDPSGYGRVIRDDKGEFIEIIEQLDATPEQRDIREVFPSYYCVRTEDLLWSLGKLTNQNVKGEYYLTDIFAILKRGGRKVLAVQAVTAEDVLSVNTRQQQAEVDQVMQERIQRQLRESGVAIASSSGVYIEADVSIGPDTVVRPFSFIGRGASIGAECAIGPMAHVPRNGIVTAGSTVAGALSIPEVGQ